MTRPCFIVVDQEHYGNISTRKLVIESAKFNVITAYSCAEGIETLRRFPAVDAVVFSAEVGDMPAPDVIASFKEINRAVPVVLIGYPRTGPGDKADYHIDSFEPKLLLELLKTLDPQKTSAVLKQELDLKEKETHE